MKNQNILKVLKHFLFFLVSFPVIILACEEDNTPTEKDPVDNTFEGSYVIIDTYQNTCYDNDADISAPSKGDDFYGQDAQHTGNLSNFVDNGNGTVTDLTTGLMWMQELPDEKYNYAESVTYAENCTLAGFTDWRLPTIKELYSLIRFDGATGLDQASSIPYIDTGFFEFRFGAEFGERYIDAQYVTSTIYKGTTMDGNETMFGVNFVDGRIKGYPTFKDFEIRLVRGNTNYGINNFIDNGDGTITDANTDLMWDAQGSSSGMNWQEALAWAQQKNADKYLGYDNWRLPNAKELQSIVDYKKSPSYSNSAAISELFNVPEIITEGGETGYPWYWTSTTHYDGPSANKAAYVCFGEALGYWSDTWQDVHGAGAQRSDPKAGNPDDYPYGHGLQNDAIRINNFVRLVRDL